MTSKIPVRRARTVGTENENARPSQAVVRAKPVQHLGAAASSSKVTTTSTDATAPRVALGEKKTDSDATANGKRKRAALQEVLVLKNRGGKGKDKEVRTTVTMPKETTTREPLRVLPPIEEGALPSRPPVFIAPPATRVSDAAHHRRSSSGRSLIPDDDAHVSKRQRTSSVGPEDENEIATELGAYTDDEEEPEADPDGDLWDDLDAADFDDPLMVSEYVADIQLYLKEAEVRPSRCSARAC
ncbi:hypothetical protein B0H10DRAFT_2021422 [Mycena sp. CBHHK59/15]|nr:hypothetical protein B0H10DRAFT_2021422 [Mycena sp. CBHHK59/15]